MEVFELERLFSDLFAAWHGTVLSDLGMHGVRSLTWFVIPDAPRFGSFLWNDYPQDKSPLSWTTCRSIWFLQLICCPKARADPPLPWRCRKADCPRCQELVRRDYTADRPHRRPSQKQSRWRLTYAHTHTKARRHTQTHNTRIQQAWSHQDLRHYGFSDWRIGGRYVEHFHESNSSGSIRKTCPPVLQRVSSNLTNNQQPNQEKSWTCPTWHSFRRASWSLRDEHQVSR